MTPEPPVQAGLETDVEGPGNRVVVAAAALLFSTFFFALLNVNSLVGVHHITGIWMALAQYASDGMLYPPLEAQGHYAGTRYSPLFFLLIAGVRPFVGDYLLSAKSLAMGTGILLAATVAGAVWRQGRNLRWCVAIAGVLLGFQAAFTPWISPHADALAVVLSLCGLLLLDEKENPSWSRCFLAGICFLFSLLSKWSSVAAVVAGLWWLWRKDRKQSAIFAAGLFVAGISAVAGLQAITDGRFLLNLRTVGSGGGTWNFAMIAGSRLMFALRQDATYALFGVMTLAVMAFSYRNGCSLCSTLWPMYLFLTFLTTLMVFASPGTESNHLLEMEVATLLVFSSLWLSDLPPSFRKSKFPHVLLLAAAMLGLWHHLAVWRGWSSAPHRSATELLAALKPAGPILAEDATVAVLLGRHPVVLDAFCFRILAEREIVDPMDLVWRIQTAEFSHVVMMARMDIPEESLCPQFHFGPEVTDALLQAYEYEKTVAGYHLYRPRRL